MTFALILVATLTPLVLAAFLLLGRCWRRWQSAEEPLSLVTRQHFEIFQTGELNESEVENAKKRFRALFERGNEQAVEASLQAGTQFIFQVRALAEIGTEAAGRILERQLRRRLSEDELEQSCYWIDLATSLRLLNRQESLPHLLRCSREAMASPLGHYFAAETICLLGFSSYLRHPETVLGQMALRVLHRATEGLRFGLPPFVISESRLGETLEAAWDHRPTGAAPLHVRIVHESLRLLRRMPHLKAVLGEEMAERESFDWQFSRIASLESAFRDWLKETPAELLGRVASAHGEELADLLRALADLRVDAAAELLPRVHHTTCEQRDLMIDALRWSRDPRVADWMRDYAREEVAMAKRAQRKRLEESPKHPSIAPEIGYRNVLLSLRGHPSIETERFLMLACQDWDPLYRMAALGSLGWWEPYLRDEIQACLATCRRDPSPTVRQMARAALARLGERASLHWFRQALLADDPHQIAEAAHVIANEGLTLLWPDLDRLMDNEHSDVALHAREAVERLAEEMELSRSYTL